MIGTLEQLHENNPKSYWKLLENLKSGESVGIEPPISADEWVDHFSNLNIINGKCIKKVQEISSLLEVLDDINGFNELDCGISSKELHDAAISLKSNNSVSFDSVLNEMLKCGFNQLQSCLIKVFNSILNCGTYPTIWKNAYTTPMYKGGSSDDPNN